MRMLAPLEAIVLQIPAPIPCIRQESINSTYFPPQLTSGASCDYCNLAIVNTAHYGSGVHSSTHLDTNGVYRVSAKAQWSDEAWMRISGKRYTFSIKLSIVSIFYYFGFWKYC